MKKLFLAIFLTISASFILVLSPKKTGGEDTQIPLVFIMAGQSNMEGLGHYDSLPKEFEKQPNNIIFINNGEVMDFKEQRYFGPEVSFLHLISEKYPSRLIIIIKEAYSGSSLYDWVPNWDQTLAEKTQSKTKSSLYQRMYSNLKKVRKETEFEVGGVFWMQGESDAMFDFTANEYESNLERFVDRLRLDLDDENVPFIYVQVNPRRKSFPEGSKVANAQLNLRQLISNSVIIFPVGMTKYKDNLHYDSDALLKLGERFFAAYNQVVSTN